MKKIDVNILEKDEDSDVKAPESESPAEETAEEESLAPQEALPVDEGEAGKKEPEDTPVPDIEEAHTGEEMPADLEETDTDSVLEEEEKAGAGGGGSGSKPPAKKKTGRNIMLFLLFLIILSIVFLLTKPEFVPGFFKLDKDTVLVVEEIVPADTQEFSIVPADDEKAGETLARIQKAMDGQEKVVPENIQVLKRRMAESAERLNRLFLLSRHFPSGLFWSYYTTSSGFELLEMKATEVGLFEQYFNRVMKNKLFDTLEFFSYDGKYWDSLEGVFVGSYTPAAKAQTGPLYTMSAEDFLDYTGYAAQKAGINFTDRNSSMGKSVIPGTKQTVFELTFYGTVNQLADFADEFLSIPATFTITKVLAGRRPSDSYPDPLKLTLFVSLYEKE
ncbi:hypothetical protein [Fidelibacter multiformis]|uniref:hypothetical protein n=1 Tax=Fidelibacter multiformis TaxID=3377529 RepID=UPI0037DCC1E5